MGINSCCVFKKTPTPSCHQDHTLPSLHRAMSERCTATGIWVPSCIQTPRQEASKARLPYNSRHLPRLHRNRTHIYFWDNITKKIKIAPMSHLMRLASPSQKPLFPPHNKPYRKPVMNNCPLILPIRSPALPQNQHLLTSMKSSTICMSSCLQNKLNSPCGPHLILLDSTSSVHKTFTSHHTHRLR